MLSFTHFVFFFLYYKSSLDIIVAIGIKNILDFNAILGISYHNLIAK